MKHQKQKSEFLCREGNSDVIYTVLYDPDGDYTDVDFYATEFRAMLEYGSLSPGTIYKTPQGEIKTVLPKHKGKRY